MTDTDRQRIEAIRARVAAATEGPWEVRPMKDRSDIAFDAYAVVAHPDGGRNLAICDTFNGDLVEIHEEADEDGVRRWDEPGRRNMEFVAEARQDVPFLLSLLDTALAMVSDLREESGYADGWRAAWTEVVILVSNTNSPTPLTLMGQQALAHARKIFLAALASLEQPR